MTNTTLGSIHYRVKLRRDGKEEEEVRNLLNSIPDSLSHNVSISLAYGDGHAYLLFDTLDSKFNPDILNKILAHTNLGFLSVAYEFIEPEDSPQQTTISSLEKRDISIKPHDETPKKTVSRNYSFYVHIPPFVSGNALMHELKDSLAAFPYMKVVNYRVHEKVIFFDVVQTGSDSTLLSREAIVDYFYTHSKFRVITENKDD